MASRLDTILKTCDLQSSDLSPLGYFLVFSQSKDTYVIFPKLEWTRPIPWTCYNIYW